MSVEQWHELYDVALWVRAAERINVRSGGIVPGPLDIEPLPEATTDGADLVEGWLGWWQALTSQPRWPVGRLVDLAAEGPVMAGPPPVQVQFAPPEFPGLSPWPSLHRVVLARWPQAHGWHNARKTTGLRDLRHHHRAGREGEVVAEVERALGRRVPAFDVEFIVVPVLDQNIRQLAETRYLVPEMVYSTPKWAQWLRALVVELAG